MNERTMTARERYELNHPLIETIGEIEIRKQGSQFCATLKDVGLFSVLVGKLEYAREYAEKANNLLAVGFMLYGFHGVSIFDYDKLMKWAATAHKSQIEKYWLYI